ncbi:MAG TPA: metallophosphoesterase [Chitinophagaceae bacterium]|jgi:hypothetical protein|nr:metallophosphoesterase [Chitinophagaceae bacterium]
MRNSPFWILVVGFMLLLDFYVFQAIKVVAHSAAPRTKTVIFTGYWVLSVLALLVFLLLPLLQPQNMNRGVRTVVLAVVIGLFLAKVIAALFLLIDDLRRGIQWLAGRFSSSGPKGEDPAADGRISRSVFLSWAGLGLGTTLLGAFIYGFTNKYNYRLRRVPLSFGNLPAAFRGLRVVQISDVHSGSLENRAAVERGIDQILALKPDLILFTGDLVNNVADEMREYQSVFSRLKAPMGVYSVLGNHDYGDYHWGSHPTGAAAQEKAENLERLKSIHAAMGWRLLLNEHVLLEKGGEQIALLGVENWSAKANFSRYGDLQKAYTGSEGAPFKILMSHDPSHWDAEVRTRYTDIDLMLSGHTHGMQFGVETPWLRWSPVQYVYRQWAGLYNGGKQRLYVNRGFGFIGYPGRVGILPEITLLELS